MDQVGIAVLQPDEMALDRVRFGAFGRHAYGVDNPLIGQPFIYQYLTSLRSDSLPASADDLVYMKGMGWANNYPIGSETWDHGPAPR